VYVEAWCDMHIREALWKVLYVMKCSLRVPSVMLGGSNFSVISGILGVNAISAPLCSLFSSVSK